MGTKEARPEHQTVHCVASPQLAMEGTISRICIIQPTLLSYSLDTTEEGSKSPRSRVDSVILPERNHRRLCQNVPV